MPERLRRVVLVAVFALSCAAPPAAQATQVVDLGVAPAGSAQSGYTPGARWSAINNAGQVAGTARPGTSADTYAARWQGGKISYLSGQLSYGLALSASSVFGLKTPGGAGTTQFAYWAPGEVTLPGKASGEVDSVTDASENGNATGASFVQPESTDQVIFLMRPPGYAFQRIPNTNGGSQAPSINDAGHVTATDKDLRPFLYADGVRSELSGIAPAGNHAINSADDIVGRAVAEPRGPLLRRANGSLVDLALPAGSSPTGTFASAVADDGTVVGSATVGGKSTGIIWPKAGPPQELDARLPAGSGWHVEAGSDISNNGQWILASGRPTGDTSGPLHTLVLQDECSAGPAIAVPAARHLGTTTGWSMDAAVSANDGVVLTNVKLGERVMATKMSLPYYQYAATAADGRGVYRGELIADGDQPAGRSHLTTFSATAGGDGAVRVTARYEIDRMPSGACMAITQDYIFKAATPGDHCEPAGKLPCARFEPRAGYELLSTPNPLSDISIELPQRLEFDADGAPFNSASLFQDPDSALPDATAKAVADGIDPLSAPIISAQLNPVAREFSDHVIEGGVSTGGFDNFHQTFMQATSAPRVLAPENIFGNKPFATWGAVPGCPECIHMHWRWGLLTTAAPGFADGNNGRVRVPPGSTQSLSVCVLKAGVASEEDPVNWRLLDNNESLNVAPNAARALPATGQKARLAFWYAPTGHAPAETTFIHGAFFGLDAPGLADVTQLDLRPRTFTVDLKAKKSRAAAKPKAKTKKTPAGATLKFKLKEWGTAAIEIQRQTTGRKVGKTCAAKTKKNARRKSCKRTVVLSTLQSDGGTDATRVSISGAIGKRALKPGRYVLSVRGRDLSGDLSKARTVAFTITAKTKK